MERIREVLEERLSHDFPGMISHPQGWDHIVEKLHHQLIEIVPDYTLFQTKEKFGALRFYPDNLHGRDESVWKRVMRILDDASVESTHTCQQCGLEGKQRNVGWIMTLCDKCAAPYEEVELDTWEDEGGLDPSAYNR